SIGQPAEIRSSNPRPGREEHRRQGVRRFLPRISLSLWERAGVSALHLSRCQAPLGTALGRGSCLVHCGNLRNPPRTVAHFSAHSAITSLASDTIACPPSPFGRGPG